MSRRRILSLGAAGALICVGLALCGQALWIAGKAVLAQVLMERAWAQSAERPKAPWPWADTWPVARLEAPRQGVDHIVLAGASLRTMAFGPGHHSASAPPGSAGNTVLAGHRDTHFSFLRDLRPGDPLTLTLPDGRQVVYRVEGAEVVHESDLEPLQPSASGRLTLITCYPFDAVVPGGPLRYVVAAAAASETERFAALAR